MDIRSSASLSRPIETPFPEPSKVRMYTGVVFTHVVHHRVKYTLGLILLVLITIISYTRESKAEGDPSFVRNIGYGEGMSPGDVFLYGGTPSAPSFDSSGNMYVFMGGSKEVVKFDSDGNEVLRFGHEGTSTGEFKTASVWYGSAAGVLADADGNMFVLDAGNHRIQKFDDTGGYVSQFTHNEDAYTIRYPSDIFIDSNGNKFIANTGYIQKINADGVHASTFGSSGSGNGQFSYPTYLTGDSSGNIYVADYENQRIQKFDSSGNFLLTFGSQGTGNGQFLGPSGVTVDTSGNVYVADAGNNRIQKFDSSGNFLFTFGSSGSGNGQFNSPSDVAVDTSGNIYVADFNNDRIQKFDSSGNFLFAFGSYGQNSGQFSHPGTLAIDSSDNLYVGDSNNNRWIQKFDSSGNFLSAIGMTAAAYPGPFSLDTSGSLYVTDRNNDRIQVFNQAGVFQSYLISKSAVTFTPVSAVFDSLGNIYVASLTTVMVFDHSGNFIRMIGSQGSGDGQFNNLTGIGIDGNDVLYTIDRNNFIQKFTTSGTFLAKYGTAGSGNGQFNSPVSIAISSSNVVYVADYYGHNVQTFDSSGNFVARIISQGQLDGQVNLPTGVALSPTDEVYVSQGGGYSPSLIQKFSSSGSYISSFKNGTTVDSATFHPYKVAQDPSGNFFAVDDWNGRVVKFSHSGEFVTSFGSYEGEHAFNWPANIATDQDGNVYVADCSQGVKKFSNNGVFLTDFATSTSFSCAVGITTDLLGNVYVSDDTGSIESVYKFDASGNLLLSFEIPELSPGIIPYPEDITVDLEGDIYVVDSDGDGVQKFDASGEYLATFYRPRSSGYISGVGVDAEGYVYLSSSGSYGVVDKYASDGTYMTSMTLPAFAQTATDVLIDGTTMLIPDYMDSKMSLLSLPITPVTPVISNVVTTSTATSTVVQWDTDVRSNAKVHVGSILAFASSSSSYDIYPRTTSHEVVLTGLARCSRLNYLITSVSLTGGIATTSGSFVTDACTGSSSVLDVSTVEASTTATSSLSISTLSLAIPPDFSTSTEATTTFQVLKLEPHPFYASASFPSGKIPATTDVYHLIALSDATTTLTSFSAPISVSFTYDAAALAGITAGTLSIYRYDGNQWYPLSGCVAGEVANTITCSTTHFSDFSLFGTPLPGISTASAPSYFVYLEANAPSSVSNRISNSTSSTPQTASTSSFSRYLYRGVLGGDVSLLQTFLSSAKDFYPEALVTGYYGMFTYEAIKRYQCANHIVCSGDEKTTGWGVFGPNTKASILKAMFGK